MISAGRVLIVPRGNWDKDTTYHMLDMVNYNGYAYLAKRTVVGIEPKDHSDEWHNMLAINEIIENAMADVLAESVGKLLEDKFAELLSEARYVTNLFDDYDVPTFVRWDGNTENTPYKAGLTACYEGFALVHGKFSLHHTVSAWVTGGERNECFIHTVTDGTASGWDRTITSAGGTMVGPLGLGGGKGTVFADDNGVYLEAVKDEDNKRVVKLENPESDVLLEDSVKLMTTENGKTQEFNLFGEHNPERMAESGFARIQYKTYTGTGVSGSKYPNSETFDFVPKVILFHGRYTAIYGANSVSVRRNGYTETIYLTWNGKTVSWYGTSSEGNDSAQLNSEGFTYLIVALG